ncbi:MAG TPA: MFS transporter [Kofleriaceae bacterium]
MTGQRRTVLAPAVLLFGIMVAHAILETARDALFLARLGPERLASAYLTIAIVAMAAVAAVRRWGGVRDPRRMLVTFLVVAVVGTSLLAVAIPTEPSLVFVLYVWTGLVATLVVPSFWTLIDRSLRVTEAKRVFAAIGAGGVLGAMIGSALAGVLGRVMAAHHLVTAGALAFGLTAIAAMLIAPAPQREELPPVRKRVEVLSQRSRRYVRLLILAGIVSTVTLTLADLTFKRVLAERFAAGDLATAFGAIYTLLNFVGLVIQLAVTPKLLARWGVGNTLTVLPILLVATASGFALTGALIAIILLKLSDGGLRHSLHRVASEILYLPVPSLVRDGWKPVADAISHRGGQAIAALISFAIVLAGGAQLLGMAVAVLGVAWLIAIRVVKRAYVEQFRDTLRAGEIERDVRAPTLDADSTALLTEALASPDEVEALAALELLARGGHVPALVLYHPRESVVRRALTLLDGQPRPDVAHVLGHLIDHSDPKIRAAALIAASRTGSNELRLEAAVTDADPDVRAAALIGLASTPDHEQVVSDGVAALQAGSSMHRIALAHAIGDAPHERFRRTLYQLLALREPAVTREVLRALARAPQLAHVDRLLPLLEDPHVRGDARRVFTATGAQGLDKLIAALDDPRTAIGVRRHLPRTISRFHSPIATAALVARLPREPDGTTEFKILRALGRMRANDPSLAIDASILHDYLRRSIADAVRYTMFLDGMVAAGDPSPGAELVRELLREKRRWAIEHTFRALGILHPRDDLRSVHDALLGGSENRRGAALEIIEALLPAELRAPLFATIEDLTPDQRRSRLGDLAPGPFATYEALLAAQLADPSESLKCVVAHHIAERHLVSLRHELSRLRPPVGPPLVIYAFDQAIARLDV